MGSFLESFRGDELAADLGYRLGVAQANCSVSRQGVIRGVHFADVPPGQAKYVSCVRGAIVDVVVDLRVGSPGFGRWEAVRLDDENHRSVFIAEGLGHAFMALTDECTVVYLCSTLYMPGRTWHRPARSCHRDRLARRCGARSVLEAAPSLAEALRNGLLPQYADCAAYTARLRHVDAALGPLIAGPDRLMPH